MKISNELWNDEYLLGIKEIDSQHKIFVATLTELYEAIYSGKAANILNETFKKLTDYAKHHFATEEKYFDKFKYEGAEEHKNEHKKFKEKINSLAKEIETDKTKISFELIDFLEDWLVEHVSTMDKKYVQCFKENGLK